MFMPGLRPDSLGWGVHHEFARAVRQLGHGFELLTTGARQPSTGTTNVKVATTDPRWWTIGRLFAPLFRTPSVLPSAVALAGYLRRDGHAIDVLHVEVAYPHGAAATLAARMSGWDGPIVVTPMGEDILVLDEASYGFRRHFVPRQFVSWTLRRASYIRCISPMLEQRIAGIAPQTPRRVVPLNVSGDAVTAASEPASTRAERRRRARVVVGNGSASSDRRLILALGRLHPFKGIETLVRAMPQIPDADLLIAGPSLTVPSFGDMATLLRGVAKQVGVSDRVRWIGAVSPERALDMLAAADVVAVPSHLESLNKVCVESAAVGTPFVVTETTGISAWVTDEGVGVVVPTADPDALGRALSDVLSGRWRHDADRAAAFVKPFAAPVVAAQLVEIYESVVDGRHRPGNGVASG